MARNMIICNNCKETKTHCAKGLCKDCYNKLPEVKKRKKEYAQRTEVKERMKEYQKEYYQQPENIEYKKQWSKKYQQRPEIKKRNAANMRRYREQPEVKERMKEYNQRPEVKQRRRERERLPETKEQRKKYFKKYYQRSGVKERLNANKKRYRTNPKFKHQQEHEKQHHKEYMQRPEIKERIYQQNQIPEKKKRNREKQKKFRKTPKGKKAMQKHNAYINLIYKPTHGNIELMPDVFPDEISTTPHHIKNNINNPESKLDFYMFLPRITHEFVGGAAKNNGHWYHNAEWIKKIYCIDIKALLEGNNFMI